MHGFSVAWFGGIGDVRVLFSSIRAQQSTIPAAAALRVARALAAQHAILARAQAAACADPDGGE